MVGLLRGPAGARSQRPARQPRLGQSILNSRQVSMRDDLCQTGGPNGAFACSIPPRTAKNQKG